MIRTSPIAAKLIISVFMVILLPYASDALNADSFLFLSNQHTVAVVDLVLDDLRRKAGVGFQARFEALVLVLHLDRAIPLGLSRAGEGQAALFGLVGTGVFDDLRVEHHGRAAVVVEDDDPLGYPDHVRGHTDAAVPVRRERVSQVLRDGQIQHRGRRGFLCEEDRVFYNGLYHGAPLTADRILRCCPGSSQRGTWPRSDPSSR